MDCYTCGGNGEWKCPVCSNALPLAEHDPQAASCYQCNGLGYVICPTCGGNGYLEQNE